MTNTKKIATLGIASLLAGMISYLELFFSPLIPIPGMKLGFSNIILLIVIISFSLKDALIVGFLKSLFASFMSGVMSSFIYSMPSSLVAIFVMYIMLRFKPRFSNIGVSVMGSLFNNLTQVIISFIILKSIAYFYYLPYMIIVGTITGTLVGIIVNLLEKRKVLWQINLLN